ncbi:HAF repeat-containing protein [Massilia sp. YIM B02769]|uniref:HAF repeat-containing protein n=1 Tax=Massilia sp. YIM B02769 TaxID=3050129 RepID=UPI0025B6DE4B|nr:HAF repeat-containing protein [Massilia sp. YIM B02769]MDN4061378.1 HAF repeat-containing protein [Massilia sp. YIM B02769]
MLVRNRISLVVLSLAAGLASASPGYAEYRVTIVGPANSRPTAINAAGAVTSIISTGTLTYRSFVNYGRGVVNLNLPGSTSNIAVGINDKGDVLGNWTTSTDQARGYVYSRGSFRQLNAVRGQPTRYVDINNAGYILATSTPPTTDPAGANPRGYLRAPNGSYRDIGTLPYPNPTTQPEALNNRNQVTGESGSLFAPEIPFYAFVWNNGVIRQLGSFGNTPNYGLDINDRGQVAGYTSTETFREALATVWTHGRPQLIDTRPAGDYRFSTAQAINNHGHVVGNSNHLGPFIYRGKRMESLNTLIDRRSGWTVDFSRGINDAGQIIADASRGGVGYAVRLDLIRPHALGAAPVEADD